MPEAANELTISAGFFTQGGPLTMSSREIAELVEKRHDNVKRTIDSLVAAGLVHPQIEDEPENDALGRARITKVYRVGKRDSYVIVAQLSPEFTARLVDRWQELEAQAQSFDPSKIFENPAVMRGLLLAYTEKVMALEQANAQLTPKAEALDLISASNGSLTITQASKLLSVKVAELTRWMNANRWIYRQNGSWLAYMDQIQNGSLEYKEANYTDRNTGMAVHKPYCHITPKGLAKLAHELGVSAPGGEMH
ncbi:DNA-binding protein [Granulibacter bethesdensis]|uniref:DNA-binding protein n=1 Tax=Granulibacter bethesdensis TaxID=364410 RepID=A0AAN0VG88_9PROT|nr:phage antirepressor KilAC domain-containing protein [Granulibacter bethesdensis]AHJ63265.1 DNA-binding protein [Granulibacter bethesdensis]